MRPTLLARYVLRLFLGRAVAVLLGLTALLVLLDLLERATDILGRAGVGGIGRYVLLRLPGVTGQLVPLAVLVGALLTFRRLAASLEMAAIWSTGAGPWRLLGALLPACAGAAILQAALLLGLAPRTERAWLDWWDTRGGVTEAEPLSQRLWLRDGRQIVALDGISGDGQQLQGLMVVRRDADGRILARTDAPRAVHDRAGWQLQQASTIRPGDSAATIRGVLAWPEGPSPDALRALARPTDSQDLRRLLAGARGEGALSHGPAFFATRLQAAAAALVQPAVMVLLALPAAFVLPRQSGATRRTVVGLVLGLGLLVAGGLMRTVGEAGRLDPVLAAWIMPACFTLAGLACVFREDV